MADPKPLRATTIIFTDGTHVEYQIAEDDLARLITELRVAQAPMASVPAQTLDGQPRTLLVIREQLRFIG